MGSFSWKALLLAGLVSHGLAASSVTTTLKPKPSPTSAAPSKTSCAYAQTSLSPKPAKAVCNGRGSLSKAAEIERVCYYYDRASYQGQPDCYHSCSRDSRCVSFGWDPYNEICRLYSKPIADMGFQTNETSLFLWDLRSCYVCNQPPLPVRPACPATTVDAPDSQRKNYVCDTQGTLATDTPVAVFDSYITDFQGCYDSCVDYDRSGLCQAFTYGSPSFKEYECRIYSKSLRELGFKADGTGPDSYNLRGCYNCTLPPTSTQENCKPTDILVAPRVDNADFQETQHNDALNFSYPVGWGTGSTSDLYSAKQGNNGNIVGAMYNPGHYNQFIGNIHDFDQNPYTPYHLYNVTFEWALPSYKVANETSSGNCTVTYGPTNDPGLVLSSKLVGTTLKKRGPFLFDAAGQGPGIYANMVVQCNGAQAKGDNVTVWFDNVQYTQYGKVVAGVGSK